MPKDGKTKDENDRCKRFLAQQSMFLSVDERLDDAFRAGYRQGREFEAARTQKLLAKLTKG